MANNDLKADCVFVGKCVGVNNYTRSNGNPGCVVTATGSSGTLLSFMGDKFVPEFSFGQIISISFNVSVFNNRPSTLRLVDVREG